MSSNRCSRTNVRTLFCGSLAAIAKSLHIPPPPCRRTPMPWRRWRLPRQPSASSRPMYACWGRRTCTVVPCPRCPRRLRRGRGCRPRGWGYHRLARRAFLPVIHLRMSEHDTSGRRPSTRRWRRHPTRCRSPVTRCRLPVTGSISKVPVDFGGAF